MKPVVTIWLGGGEPQVVPIEGERLAIGSAPTADLCLAEPWLAPEHILVAPRGEQCWVSVAQGGTVVARAEGKHFSSGFLPWGAELEVGPLRLRVDRPTRARNRAAPATEERSNKPSPVIVMALLATMAWVGMQALKRRGSEPTSASASTPALFDPAGPCTAANPAHRAELAATTAEAKRERYLYSPQDGVEAVALFREAAACFEKIGDPRAAAGLRRDGDELAERIELDLRARRLRLERALDRGDDQGALVEVRALAELIAHRPDSDLAAALRQLEHRLYLQGEQP